MGLRGAWAKVWSIAVLLMHRPALAQSVSMEEKPEGLPVPAVKALPVAPSPVVRVIPPEPLLTDMAYPDGARGEAAVELLLTMNAEGAVTEAIAVSGADPFAAHAARAALAWKFRPALRNGRAVAAKIRFLARFLPPPEAPPLPLEPPSKRSVKPAVSEIVVLGEREPMRQELRRIEISRLPGAFDDAFRAIEALPGVTPVASGLPYFYVRGAPPGNVGYFFDGIPVPFLYHFGAGPSVFHPAFVERVDLYPGAYPVRYGRYAGAIVAGELSEPTYRTHGEWKVRLVDSGAMVEVPFAAGRGTAMLAGRVSYTGLVFSVFSPKVFLVYGDYQGRVRYDLTQKDSIEILAFGSSDYATNKVTVEEMTEDRQFVRHEKVRTLIDVGFHRLDLRWNRRWGTGTARTALMLGRDFTGLADGHVDVRNNLLGARTEVRQQLNDVLRVSAGGDLLVESLRQDIVNPTSSSDNELVPGLGNDVTISDLRGQGVEDRQRRDISTGAFADIAWDATPALRVTPGVRADLFVSGQRSAVAVDPRVTAEYRFGKKVKVAHGLALVHQGPSFVGAVPGLKPSLERRLQSAVQASSSVSFELPAGFSSSVSFFQTIFSDMTDLLSLTRLAQAKNETDGEPLAPGVTPPKVVDERTNGGAQGVELMLRRSLAKRVGGFLSYTLSRSFRSSGRASGPSGSDRRHVVNVGGSVDLGRDWRFGGRAMVYSGVPSGVAYLQAARHPPRTPPFWRLDFKLEKRWYVQRPHLWWGLSLEVLNATFNQETLRASCNAFTCAEDKLGPITVPSLAVEGAF